MGRYDPERHRSMAGIREEIIAGMDDPKNPTDDEARALREINDLIADSTDDPEE